MRNFLGRFAKVESTYEEHDRGNLMVRDKYFKKVKESIVNGVPVIVHQYWKEKGSRGHYRIVTGYDESRKIIYLNDPNPGKKITQTYF